MVSGGNGKRGGDAVAGGAFEPSRVAEAARTGPPYDDLVIFDNHLHFGHAPAVYEAAADPVELARQMSRIGIRVAVVSSIWAIFSGDIRAGNDEVLAALDRFPDRYLGYVVVHPAYPELLASELERCLSHPRMRGIKLHPTQYSHPVKITDPRYRPAFEHARGHGYPILVHTGPEAQRAYCGADEVARVAREFPSVPVILAHTMGFDRWEGVEEAVAVAARLDNAYVDLSGSAGRHYGLVEYAVQHAGSEKILYGSDVPQLTFTFPLGPVFYADIPDRDKENILGLNTARMFDIPLP